MIEQAKSLIELGMPIIPICPANHKRMSSMHVQKCRCPGKTPLIAGWTSRNQTTMKDLELWASQFGEDFNIGMPLGEVSGYCGIDVDGEAGVQLLMEMSKGDLPSTWEFSTAAGSRLLYRIPEGIKTKKFKQSGNGPHEECALLCTGQQTVMPPSIHHTGATYTWEDGHSPFDIPCAIAPVWLIEKIKQDSVDIVPISKGFDFAEEFGTNDDTTGTLFEEDLDPALSMNLNIPPDAPSAKSKKSGKGHKIVVDDQMLSERIPEGQRDNTMTAIVGHYCANRDLRRLGKEMILNICLQHNQQYCDPPLEDSAIIDKVNYFFDMETTKDSQYAAQGKTVKRVFEASVMAKNVLEYLSNKGILLQFDQFTKLYYYTLADEGPWRCTHNATLVNHWIRDVVTSPHYGEVTWDKRSYIEETRVALEEHFTSPFKQTSDFDLGSHSEELSKYIVCNDGMLDWRTSEIKEWDPSFRTTLAFPIDFIPDAECPLFEGYLKDWLPDEDVRKVIQEFMGYCLIPNTNFRKALFLYGKGRNGKSVFVEYFQEFFGTLSGTLSYDALFQRFGPAHLKDKLVNIHDDTNVSFAKDTGVAKNLIAGGQISAEYKGKDHFTFKNVARIIFSAQETPRTADTTLAWYDRWIFVKFPVTFRASNSIKEQILADLRSEKSGIFNWMLEGLRRLMDQDGFTNSDTLDEYVREYRGLNDNVVQFLITYCVRTENDIPSERISIGHLYQIYEMFTERENLRKFSKKMFTARIEDAGHVIKKGKVGNYPARYFENLALNQEAEEVRDNKIEIQVILTTRSN